MIENDYSYVCNYYRVPACTGRRILFNGRPGVIAEARGNYIGVNFDDDKPGVVRNLHPTWKVEYLGIGKVRKPSRSHERYQRYLRADSGLTFKEWIGGAE